MGTLNGRCQCGDISYEVIGDPLLKTACHCLDCQKASGGAFTTTMVIMAEHFMLRSGQLSRWEKVCDDGAITHCYFCSKCSNRIFHVNSANENIFRLKAGSLDHSAEFMPQVHLWIKRKQPWLVLGDDVAVFDTQPETPEQLFAAIAKVSQ